MNFKKSIKNLVYLFLFISGCTFNLKQHILTPSWEFNTEGMEMITISKNLMEDSDISISGIESDTLVLKAYHRKLLLNDENVDIDDMTCSGKTGKDSLFVITLDYTEENWQSVKIDEISVSMNSVLGVNLCTEDGDIFVNGLRGMVNTENKRGETYIDITGECKVTSRTGDVFITADENENKSLDIEVNTTVGDVTIYLPEGLGFDMKLETERGEVDLPSGNTNSALNGGSSVNRIKVNTSSGNISIIEQ